MILRNSFIVLLLVWIIVIPFKNAIYHISTFGLVVIFLIHFIKYEKYDGLKNVLFSLKYLYLSFLIILLTITLSNAINGLTDLVAWRKELMLILRHGLILTILFYFYQENFFRAKLLTTFILISLTIQGFDGIYQSIQGVDFFKNNSGGIASGLTGATFNRNIFGMLMGTALLISFSLLINATPLMLSRVQKSLLFIVLVTFIFGALFSYSRATWVAIGVAFAFYLVQNFKNMQTYHWMLVILSMSVMVLIFLNIESLQHRYELLIQLNSSHRFSIWEWTINLIQDKPFLGYGLNAWSNYGYPGHSASHNNLLNILLYTGFLGLAAWSFLLFIIIKTAWNQENKLFIPFILFFFVDAQFDQGLFGGKIFATALILLTFYIFKDKLIQINKRKV